MAGKQIVLYQRKAGIGWITLNRPGALNAVSPEVLNALSRVLDKVRDDGAVRAVALTGTGEKAFSAGADISYLNRATPIQVRDLARLAVGVTLKLERLGKPTAAAINGYALGGGLEIAEACMFRIAVPGARMGHPEVRIGAVAAWGGTTRLPRLVGRSRAAELLLTGKQVSAGDALDMGLINRIAEPESLKKETEALLREVLECSSKAMNLTWEAMSRGMDVSVEESLAIGADCFGLAAATDDFREGTEAFLEKRKPKWKGK